jgi:cell division protein FtsW (lipid II flippase)
MSNRSLSAAMTVFLLFFGIALLDSLRLRHWMSALFWVAIAFVFFVSAREVRRRKVP